MKIAGVVILYYPDDTVSRNIFSYLPHVQKLYIVDNSEIPQQALLNSAILQDERVELQADGANRGISERLNFACKRAIIDGFDWLLTMDQDSFFGASTLQCYIEDISNFQDKNKVAMFGIESYQVDEQYAKTLFVKSERLITSGSFVNLALFDEVGGFNDQLFIDEVDTEYCYQALLKNYQVLMYMAGVLGHAIGVTSYHRSLKSLKKTPRSLHSPIRLYYMVRNHLYIKKHYNAYFAASIQYSQKALFVRIKNNLLYSDNRWKVFKYILKAVADFKRNKWGKIAFK